MNTKMKLKRRLSYVLISSFAISPALAKNQTVDSHIGKLEFTHDFANGYPTKETVEKLYDERDFQRACQLYLWSLPAVSFAEWQHGQESIGAKSGDQGNSAENGEGFSGRGVERKPGNCKKLSKR